MCFRGELSEHVDSVESSLENLQNILNTQTFTFDASPLMEVRLSLVCVSVCVWVCVCTHGVCALSFSARLVQPESLTSRVWTR